MPSMKQMNSLDMTPFLEEAKRVKEVEAELHDQRVQTAAHFTYAIGVRDPAHLTPMSQQMMGQI